MPREDSGRSRQPLDVPDSRRVPRPRDLTFLGTSERGAVSLSNQMRESWHSPYDRRGLSSVSSAGQPLRREPVVVCEQPPGCGGGTTRTIAAVTATLPTRLPQAWQRHSEPGPAARAEAVVAPPGTNRPGCARSRQGTEFAESRFRASRVTFVRRQRPFRPSPRSRSSGCCSARAKRSSHRCRDKRCSVSSFGEAAGPVGRVSSGCASCAYLGVGGRGGRPVRSETSAMVRMRSGRTPRGSWRSSNPAALSSRWQSLQFSGECSGQASSWDHSCSPIWASGQASSRSAATKRRFTAIVPIKRTVRGAS